jgi:hypothetical protein
MKIGSVKPVSSSAIIKKICEYKTNIYFNQQSIRNNIVCHYAKVNVLNTSPNSKFTHKKTQIFKIKIKLDFCILRNKRLMENFLKYTWL